MISKLCTVTLIMALSVYADDKDLKSYVESHKSLSSDAKEFYKNHDYVAVWYPKGEESIAAKAAKTVLQTSDTEGLNPGDYKEAWKADFKTDWMNAELKLTETFTKFIDDVRVGRVPAKDTARTIKLTSPRTKPVKYLTDALKDSSSNFVSLTKMAPEVEAYQNLKKLLILFKKMQADWGTLPRVTKTKVKVGQSDKNIPALKKILAAHGYYKGSDYTEAYNQDASDALIDFQRHNNLTADGVIGTDTAKELNISLQQRINQIIINMERLRWFPDEMGKKYIIVNVAGYEIWAVKNDKIDVRMRAIVGQVGRKTPLFYAPLKNIIINPSWGVPKSILLRDKLPKLMDDPSYAERAGFTVTDSSGRRLDPYHVDWESVGSSINLRQKPGFQNALGRIKLNIDNPYTIYLHGTPTEKLFDKPRRNFSSGCIRMQNPNQIAAWVLQDENGWDEDRIQKEINSGKTITVNVKDHVPVYFTYLTVWMSDDGRPHFSPDAYNMDPNLTKLLKLGDPSKTEEATNFSRIRYG
ncbi:MAG: L,D-transpeptidase family protein [Candidatus Paracaedibacteraceae bacterium]|nr:L,D-transpeptidase family protein [Candidatus Paracaedibacteraceae bacterium]